LLIRREIPHQLIGVTAQFVDQVFLAPGAWRGNRDLPAADEVPRVASVFPHCYAVQPHRQ
jgi:hypothetical protein